MYFKCKYINTSMYFKYFVFQILHSTVPCFSMYITAAVCVRVSCFSLYFTATVCVMLFHVFYSNSVSVMLSMYFTAAVCACVSWFSMYLTAEVCHAFPCILQQQQCVSCLSV